jgi:hypothetical protein
MSCIFKYKGVIYLENGIKKIIADEKANITDEVKELPIEIGEWFNANSTAIYNVYSTNPDLVAIGSIYQYAEYLATTNSKIVSDVEGFAKYIQDAKFIKSSAFSSSVNANMEGTIFAPEELNNIFGVMRAMFIKVEDKFKSQGLDKNGAGYIRSTLANSWEADFNKRDIEGQFTPAQKDLIQKAINEIRTNDWFWYTFKNNLYTHLGYKIQDEITLDVDLTRKDWNEDDKLGVNPITTVSDTIKRLINTTFEVDPNDIQIKNGKRVYANNKNTPTGYPNSLDYKERSSKLMEVMADARNITEALSILHEFGTYGNTSFAKTILSLHDKLAASEELQNAWWASYHKAITPSNRILTKKQGDFTKVDVGLANKNTSEYLIANTWQNLIIFYGETGVFTKEFLTEWNKEFNHIHLITSRFTAITPEAAESLANLYSKLGITLSKETILREYNIRNNSDFISGIILPVLYITGAPSNEYKIKGTSYIQEIIKNPKAKFNQFGSILTLANKAKFLNESKVTYSSTTVKGNLMYDPQNPNFLSDFYQTLVAADEVTYTKLIDYTKVASNQLSGIIWGDEYKYNERTNDYQLRAKGIRKGFLNYFVGDNGTKIPLPYNQNGLNKANIAKAKLFMYQGIKNLNTQTAKEYTELNEKDWTVNTLFQYFAGSKEPGYALFPLLTPSDRGRIALFQSPVVQLEPLLLKALTSVGKTPEEKQDIKNYIENDFLYKTIRSSLYSEFLAMETAMNLIFERDENGNIILDYEDDYIRPRVKSSIIEGTNKTQLYYHYQLDEDGTRHYLQFKKTSNGYALDAASSGNIFSTHNIEYLVSGTPTTIETFGNYNEPFILTFLKAGSFKTFNKTSVTISTTDSTKPTKQLNVNDLIYQFVVNFMRTQYNSARILATNYHDVLTTFVKPSDAGESKITVPLTRRTVSVKDDSGNIIETTRDADPISAAFEFLINQYLFNVEQIKMFYGSTADYKGVIDFNKRAGQVEANGISNNLSGTFSAVTISDVLIKSLIFEQRIIETADKLGITISEAGKKRLKKEYPSDAAAKRALKGNEYKIYERVKPYLNNDMANATSYITSTEFSKRVRGFGKYEQYQELLNKLENGSQDLTRDELNRLATLQKNFYYSYSYNEDLQKFVPNQVKNAEVVLTYRFTRDTQLHRLMSLMEEQGISQINTASAEKVGSFDVVNIVDADGNLLDTKTVSAALKKGKKEYEYSRLVMQQEVPDAVVDHQGKFAIQIAKKIISNIPADTIYNIGDMTISGRDLIKHYFELLGANIFESASNLFARYKLTINKEGSFEGDLSIENVSNILTDQALSLELGSNIISALKVNEVTGKTLLPLFISTYVDKFQAILTGSVTKNVTVQRFPGVHAAQMTSLFINVDKNKPKQVITRKKNQDKSVATDYIVEAGDKINWLKSIEDGVTAGTRTYKLAPTRVETIAGNKQIVHAEVLLPRYSKLFYKEGKPVDINTLSDEVLEMIGYRIPYEAKYSTYIFKVVGFLPDELGATIVLPDDFVTQTGSDFDMDTVYTMYRNMVRSKDGTIQTMSYSTDTTKLKSRYNNYIRSHLELSAIKALQLNSKDLDEDANSDLYQKFLYVYNGELNSIVSDDWKLEAGRIRDARKAAYESKDAEFIALGELGKSLFKKLDTPIRKKFWDYEYTISDTEGIIKNLLYAKFAQDQINGLSEGNPNIAILKEMIEIYHATNTLLGETKEIKAIVDEAFAQLSDNVKEAVDTIYTALASTFNLLTIEEFANLPIEEQNSKKARQNRIFDIFTSILTNTQHYLESTATSSFNNIQASKTLLPPDNTLLSMTTFDGQVSLRKRVIDGKLLKGRAVAANSFVAIAQTTKMHVNTSDAPIFSYKIHENQREDYISKYGNDVTFDQKSDGLYATVIHRFIGNNTQGTFTNVLGHLIDTYFAEIPANTLDNVKKPLPPNVNPYLFGIWSMIPMVGSTYDVATLFINQRSILDINNYHNNNEEDAGHRGLSVIKNEYQTELLQTILEIDKIKADIAKQESVEYTTIKDRELPFMERWLNRLKQGKTISARPSQPAEYDFLGYKDGIVTPISVQSLKENATFTRHSIKDNTNKTELNRLIERYNKKPNIKDKSDSVSIEEYFAEYNNDVKAILARLEALQDGYVYQLQMIENFKTYNKLSESIVSGVTIFKTDSIGAGPTMDVTHVLHSKILSSPLDSVLKVMVETTDENTGETVEVSVPAAVGIYPSLFDVNYESVYKPLEDYLKYSNIASVNAFGDLFISETPIYRKLIDKLVAIQGGNYTADKAKHVTSFLNSALMSTHPWLNDISQNEKDRLLGTNGKKEIIDISKVSDETIAKFEELSVANQVELIKPRFINTNSIVTNLETALKDSDYERDGFFKINYNNTDDTDTMTRSFNDLWYSDDIYERIVARNLVRYEYLVNGFKYGYNSIAKIIPTNIFYQDVTDNMVDGLNYSEVGIGLSRFLYGKHQAAKNITFDEEASFVEILNEATRFFGVDVYTKYILNNWENDNIIPQATMRKGYETKAPRLFQVKDGIITLTAEEFNSIPNDFIGKKVKEAEYIKLFTIDEESNQFWTVFKRYDEHLIYDEANDKFEGTVYYYPVVKYNGNEISVKSSIPSNNQLANGNEILDEWEYIDYINNTVDLNKEDTTEYDELNTKDSIFNSTVMNNNFDINDTILKCE